MNVAVKMLRCGDVIRHGDDDYVVVTVTIPLGAVPAGGALLTVLKLGDSWKGIDGRMAYGLRFDSPETTVPVVDRVAFEFRQM